VLIRSFLHAVLKDFVFDHAFARSRGGAHGFRLQH
jgi:hypothetical protein